jgi:hypothetical protein
MLADVHVGLHVPLLLSDFNQTWNVAEYLGTNSPVPSIMKIRSAVVELFHSDRRTDRRDETIRRIFATLI